MSSQILSKKYPFIGANGFSGGLSSENPIALSQDKLVIADNILVATVPTRRIRGGMESYNNVPLGISPGVPIRGNIDYWRTANLSGVPTDDIFIHQGTKVWSIANRASAAVDRTGALILDPNAVPCYQPFNQKLYFVSTTTADGYNKWDGIAGTAVAAIAPADGVGKYLCSHLGRMIMSGNDTFPFRVYLSSAFDAEDWSSVDPHNSTSLDLDDDGDPDGINGMTSFQGRLYVFTRRSTYEITGTTPATFVVNRVSNGIGCIGHASIKQVPNDIIFASDRGVHSASQLDSGRQTESQFLSKDIQRLWVELANATKFKQFMATYDETINCYIISVVSGSDVNNSDLLVYNIDFNLWTQWKNIDARSISMALLNNKKQILIGREDGTLAFLNQPLRSDFGVQYNASFKTGVQYPGGDLTVEKKFLNITILASTTAPATINVSWNIDGRRGGSNQYVLEVGEDLLGSTFILGKSKLGIGQYLPYTFEIGQVGFGIQIQVSVQSPGDTEIYGYILEVENTNPVYGASII